MNYLQHNFFDDFSVLENNLKTDIIDNGDEYVLVSDMPNIKKEDIIVSYDNGYLQVSAKRMATNENYVQKERFYGEYKRNYYVGKINEEKIEASYKAGVLTIKVPKQSSNLTEKYIEIK